MDHLTKLDLITKGLGEVIGMKDLEEKIKSNHTLRVYWGTSPTGKPHIGYLVPIIKIAHLLKAGCKVTILFADLHAYLDAMKTTWDLLEHRTQYYENIIKVLLKCMNVDTFNLKFVRGTEFQLSTEYTIDVYKMLSKITVDSAQKAGAEVVKQSDNPLMSGLIYPILQILDEVYLKCDAELGGLDQRKIFMMSRDQLHKIGYKSNIHLMNVMIPSLSSSDGKMSSSEVNSKVDLIDSAKNIKKKINKSFLEPMNVECPLITFIKHVVFPILEIKEISNFVINRDEKWGGPISFSTFDKLVDKFTKDELCPSDVKIGVSDFLINLLEPLRIYFDTEAMVRLTERAYPTN